MESKEKLDNIVHSNLGKIITTQNDFKDGIYDLKNSENFTAKCITAEKLSKVSDKFNEYIYGNPLPNLLENLGASRKGFNSDNLLTEIDWFILSARKFKKELTLFLIYKSEYENHFLIGNYEKALETIERAEQRIGLSIWSITSKILVFEFSAQQDKAKLYQSEILEKNKNGVFTGSLINFISQRCERKLSAYKYNSDLNNSLNHVRSKLDQSNRDYYNFQLNFFESLEYPEIKDVLTFDYSNSIVDRYITFRKLVIYCVSNGIEVENIFTRLTYLAKRIDDDLFNTINLLFNPAFNKESFFDNQYLKILDLYYAGFYAETCNEIRNYFISNNIDFNLINIYSRSLALQNTSFENLNGGRCLINEIAENVFKIYLKNTNPAETLYGLYQTSKNIDSFEINFHLNTFIKLEQNQKACKNYFYLTAKKADPIVFEALLDTPKDIQLIFEKIRDNTFDSISLNYRYKAIQGDYESVEGIAQNMVDIDKARHLYINKKYPESLNLWRDIYSKNSNTPPIYETSIDYIFRILAENNNYESCIKWYVDNVIKNPFLVYKINTKNVEKALQKGRFKNIEINIYLPVFISLVSNDENMKAFAIELFCKSKGVSFPSELFNNPDIEMSPLTEWFFFISCSNETLNYYKNLNTTKKRLDERINICNYLGQHFNPNRELYIQELNLLTNELIIYEGTQKLDESKIYANDQAILNKELDEFEGLYNRYVTIAVSRQIKVD